MAVFRIGRVRIHWEKDWHPDRAYESLAAVSYNRATWLAIKDVPKGTVPSELNPDYWQIMSKPGADGEDGKDGADGDTGPRGLRGKEGPRGVEGPVGMEGPRGLKGDTGPQGPVGPQGPMPDYEWRDSKVRFEKPDGSWGPWVDLEGPEGQVGKEGPIGEEGPRGPKGADGARGPQGKTGATGPRGAPGPADFYAITNAPSTATRWPKFSEVTGKPATATRWPKFSEVTNFPSGSGGGVDVDKLDGLHASSFVRSNANTTVTGRTTWGTEKEAAFGNSQEYALSYGGTNMNIYMQSGNLRLRQRGGSDKFLFTQSGNFTASGSITASGDVTAFSDRRVKADLKPIKNALEKVNSITGYTFVRTDLGDKKTRRAGLIAQEVQEVLPEVVHGRDGGKLSVAYGNTVALLVEAVKELTGRVGDLEVLHGRA